MIGVTAATGRLGRLVVQALLDRGARPGEVVALARDPGKAADLAAPGVQVQHADYFEPESLRAAFRGLDRLLLISSGDLRDRVTQHRHAIDAAREANVGLIAYTSILNAGTTAMLLAADHQVTEQLIRDSGLPFAFLRNGWYTETYTDGLAGTLERGALAGAAGDGRFTPAARRDYAEAAAAVLLAGGPAGTAFELGGDEAVTLPGLAAEMARLSGRPVAYRNLAPGDFAALLAAAGLPEGGAAVIADSDVALGRGDLFTTSGDLRRLIGRPTTPVGETIREALARLG
ncbi:MAG TPA: NAD(P)H-binding protein [Deinococcales bacterium]|nr:NAD(P)H-binding protein [Deinococcales bacterium]